MPIQKWNWPRSSKAGTGHKKPVECSWMWAWLADVRGCVRASG